MPDVSGMIQDAVFYGTILLKIILIALSARGNYWLVTKIHAAQMRSWERRAKRMIPVTPANTWMLLFVEPEFPPEWRGAAVLPLLSFLLTSLWIMFL